MSYYTQVNKSSGTLIDYCSENSFNIDSEFLEVLEFEGPMPDVVHFKWDSASKTFVKRSFRTLSKLQFLSRFYPAERITARNSEDVMVKDIMAMLEIAEYIDLDDIVTQQALSYLGFVGILTSERVNEVLS